ncbi:GTPase Era [Xanthovirga aplysinae]|uniref:GTPase Era n=1 Tax=Xanthovirga aplysinae TaxID=2529853 RepID=UPI0012BD7918|nr:GTPase Era [Xanthovirga aplysinae]MTI32441.1 GTPase Era [Xanthovirga aplysinae]
MTTKSHKAGFVSIIGRPNAGKSTLMNQMVGEKLSIITSKAQTTRHRIMGILSGEDFQIVYSDTPGIINPKYELHRSMMRFVNTSLEDADVILLVADIFEKYEENDEVLNKLNKSNVPVIFLLNKIDLSKGTQEADKMAYWKEKVKAQKYISISALQGQHIDEVFGTIMELLPEHEPFFPKDELTDKPERFFAAEIIREKIFINYKKEVPYSCEVAITEFKEDENIIRMRAEIFVERKSQKGILIGHKGESLKKVGKEARLEMEKFFGKKVFLEQYVKVEPDWRRKENKLNRFGYNH